MKALLVIDVQNGIIDFKDFTAELSLIEQVIHDFKRSKNPVIFIKHYDKQEESPLHRYSTGSDLSPRLRNYADYVIEKDTPSAFFRTDLENLLLELEIEQVFITGFNTEFCCMFTAIAAYDRGYKVALIEGATGTVNSGDTYEMENLDIRDFIGTVLHWSEAIEVLEFEEYEKIYKVSKA